MSSEQQSEREVETTAVELLDKVELLNRILSDGLNWYGRFSIEQPTRPVVICLFEAPTHKVTFEVQLSEINRYRNDRIGDLANVLIDRHLQLALNEIEAKAFPDTIGGRMSSWTRKKT